MLSKRWQNISHLSIFFLYCHIVPKIENYLFQSFKFHKVLESKAAMLAFVKQESLMQKLRKYPDSFIYNSERWLLHSIVMEDKMITSRDNKRLNMTILKHCKNTMTGSRNQKFKKLSCFKTISKGEFSK